MNKQPKKPEAPPLRGVEDGVMHGNQKFPNLPKFIGVDPETGKGPQDITPEVDLAIAEALLTVGKFSDITEARGWLEEFREKQRNLHATWHKIPLKNREQKLKEIQQTWLEKVPPGSAAEMEINRKLSMIWNQPEEVIRLRQERDRLREEVEQLRREREEGALPGETRADWEALRRMEFTPVDPKGYKNTLLMAPELSKKDLLFVKMLPDGGRVIKYQRQTENSRITSTYTIPEGVKGEFPIAGSFAQEVAIQCFKFAYQQRNLSPEIRPAEMLKLIGYTDEEVQAGGKKYERLINAFQTLKYGTYTVEKKRQGKWSPVEIGEFFSNLKFHGEGKITIIQPTFDRSNVALWEMYFRGEVGGQYLAIPQRLLEARHLTRDQKRFCHWLARFQGINKPIEKTVKQLFSDPEILAYSKERLKTLRPWEIKKILRDITMAALEQGLVSKPGGWKYDYGNKPNLRSKAAILAWRMKFYPPKENAWKVPEEIEEEVRQVSPPPRPSSGSLADRITEWLTYPQFKTRTSKAEVRKQLENTIKKYGEADIGRIFQQEANGNSPHPVKFWNRIKEMKAASQGKKSPYSEARPPSSKRIG